MKRRWLNLRWERILVLGVLGAVTNVVVCWCLTLGIINVGRGWSHDIVRPAAKEGTFFLFSGSRWRAGVRWLLVPERAILLRPTPWHWQEFEPVGVGDTSTGELVQPPEALRAHDFFDNPAVASAEIYYFGLPFEALSMTYHRRGISLDVSGAIVLPASDWLDSRLRWRIDRSYMIGTAPVDLPIGVTPLGFAGNTACFALAWHAARFGIGDARRAVRRRRNQCERCGYSRVGLNQQSACPECGTQPRRAIT